MARGVRTVARRGPRTPGGADAPVRIGPLKMDTAGSATPSAQEIALLRKLARLTHIGAWEYDVASERVFWTEEAFRLHDVEPGTFTPTRDSTLAFFAPEARPLFAQTIRNGIERGISWDLELPLITARSRRLWVRTRGEPE